MQIRVEEGVLVEGEFSENGKQFPVDTCRLLGDLIMKALFGTKFWSTCKLG